MLVVLVATGLYLLLYYKIGAPYASVERIQDQVRVGRWIRALHRYASDAAMVAIVDPSLCVSCGICAGSCAPMSVGPPGRMGRDQLPRVRAFLAEHEPGPDRVVLAACGDPGESGP